MKRIKLTKNSPNSIFHPAKNQTVMAKAKSKYPMGVFSVRKKPNKKGDVTIYLVYSINSISVPRSTGVRINIEDWDAKRQMVKTKNPSAARLNNILFQQREKVDKQIHAFEGDFTPEIIGRMMDGTYGQKKATPEKVDFIQYAIAFNKKKYDLQKISYSTYYNAEKYILAFQRFAAEITGESLLPLSNLSVDLIEEYKAYRLKKGNTKEGINKMLTPLFKAVEHAKNNELVSIKTASAISSEYCDLKERKYQSEIMDEEVNYLNESQLIDFINLYDKVSFDRTREIMDMFLFSFHACGLRVSDIITLEWKHINWNNQEICKNLYKGNVPHVVPLTPAAMEILHRWKNRPDVGRFVFNLLPDDFDLSNEALLDTQRKSKNRTLQMSLVSVGMKIGLPFNLTMHVARHTFAVFALERGISLHMISKLLGHSSVITTEKVYAKFLPASITETVKTKLSFNQFLPQIKQTA